MIETPKNLTRNILLGMFLGFIVGSFFYYLDLFPDSLVSFVRVYVFNLGSSIFVNLLKLLIVPLVFFSLVSGISSLTSMQSLGNITFKTIALYLSTTAIAVSLSLIVGSIFKPGSGYSSEIAPPDKLPEDQGIYETILDIFPANIIEAMAQMGGILVMSKLDDPHNYLTFFAKIDKVRFRNKVLPGDTLIFKCSLLGPFRRGICHMQGLAYANGKLCAEAELTAQITKVK